MLNGKGTHDLIIGNIEKLLTKRQDIRARMTFTSKTVYYLYDSINYIYNLGFKTIIPVPDYFDSNWDEESMQILKEQLEKIYSKYTYSKRTQEDVVIGLIRNNEIRFKNGICDPKNCAININYDGRLYPCSYVVNDKNYIIGDIENGLEEKKVNYIYKLSKSNNNECIGCNNYNYCISTRCKIMNKVLTGDYNKASPVFCHIENIVLDYGNKYYLKG